MSRAALRLVVARACSVAAFSFLGLAVSPAGLHSAQENSGFVTGRVTNEATGDILPNVVVTVDGTAVSASTDVNGLFRLALPPGARQLVVTYPGLDVQRVTVTVEAGRTVSRDVALNSSLYKMERYVVKGLREGQAAAIQEERQAPNVRTVAAIDAFGNPGAAVGEMLQRLAGVSVDGSGGEVGAVYIRGMTQDFSSLLVDGAQIAVTPTTS